MEPKFTVRDLRGILLAELDVEGSELATYNDVDRDKEPWETIQRHGYTKRPDQTVDEYAEDFIRERAWPRSTDWYRCNICYYHRPRGRSHVDTYPPADITLENPGIVIKMIDGSFDIGPFQIKLSMNGAVLKPFHSYAFHLDCADRILDPEDIFSRRFSDVRDYVNFCFENIASMNPGLTFENFWDEFKKDKKIDIPYGTTHRCFSCEDIIPYDRIPVLISSEDRPKGGIYHQGHSKNIGAVTVVSPEPSEAKPKQQHIWEEIYLFHPACFKKMLKD